MVPSHPYTYYSARTIWLIFGMRSAPIGNWFRGATIFFAKKRTLGNRLISCSLMTAFGQKRTLNLPVNPAEPAVSIPQSNAICMTNNFSYARSTDRRPAVTWSRTPRAGPPALAAYDLGPGRAAREP